MLSGDCIVQLALLRGVGNLNKEGGSGRGEVAVAVVEGDGDTGCLTGHAILREGCVDVRGVREDAKEGGCAVSVGRGMR